MIDLSSSEKEKESYVTGVELNDDCTEYITTYADGHTEKHPFSIHNYNVEIYRMINQFNSRKNQKIELLLEKLVKLVGKKVKTMILSLIGVVFTVAVPLANIYKLITILLIVLYNIKLELENRKKISEIGDSLAELKSTEMCIELLEKFKVDVTDPRTGRQEEWFLIDPSIFNGKMDPIVMALMSTAMTPEVKEAEGQRISALLSLSNEEENQKSL